MPGNVATSTATHVMPAGLCSAWGEGFMFSNVETEVYADGRTQRRKDADGWRREWKLSRHLTWSEFTALRTFWSTVRGAVDAFYFYPNNSHYDATGASATGRFKCRFTGQMTEQYDIGRMVLSVGLVQVP